MSFHLKHRRLKTGLWLLLLLCSLSCTSLLFSQESGLKVFFEKNYITTEPSVRLCILGLESEQLRLEYTQGNRQVALDLVPDASGRAFCDIAIPKAAGEYVYALRLMAEGELLYEGPCSIVRREHRENAVKINRLSGGLLLDERPFFPYGYYCRKTIDDPLLMMDAVRGFNMISPYWSNGESTFDEHQKMMDRCRDLGLKVHYQLLQGVRAIKDDPVGSEAFQKGLEAIKAEVRRFKDHEALLGWYIADEPASVDYPVEPLKIIYDAIKEIDPYHPITIVFVASDEKTEAYMDALDIIMYDHYPIPNHGPDHVSMQAFHKYRHDKVLWFVPQAFGGGEFWKRDVTWRELRVMTWKAILDGARGIQFFIREGYNVLPKSPTAWDEAARVAMEVMELAPAILSTELPETATSCSKDVMFGHWKKDGIEQLLVMNLKNRPRFVTGMCLGDKPKEPLRVPFEDRELQLHSGEILEPLGAWESRLYEWGEKPQTLDVLRRNNANLNPSFEDGPITGVPLGCYTSLRPGVTAFLDPSQAVDGRRSMKLTNPNEGTSGSLRFYGLQVLKDKPCLFTFWAKAHRKGVQLQASLPGVVTQTIALTEEWQPYYLFAPTTQRAKVGVEFSLLGKGQAWVDAVQVSFEPVIDVVKGQPDRVFIHARAKGLSLHYTTDGSDPSVESTVYRGSFDWPAGSRVIKAQLFHDGKAVSVLSELRR